jgi:hypothetical protein
MDPRAGFVASAVAAGFTEAQAEFLWTAIPFHPLNEEWKRPTFPVDAYAALHADVVECIRVSFLSRLCRP